MVALEKQAHNNYMAWDYNSEGSVSHINGVWPVLSVKQLFTVRSILWIKTKPTIEPPTLAFFLAETRVSQ